MTRTFCDICGAETSRLKKRTILLTYRGNRSHDFDVCETCSEKLDVQKRKAEVDFIKQSVWWESNKKENGDFDYGKFRSVGDCEQGGIQCPKCGHLNNMYLFKGKCESCGYEEEE